MTKMTRNQHIKPVVDEMIYMKKTNEAENQIYQEQTSVSSPVECFRNIAIYCTNLFTIVKSFAHVIV